MASSEISTPTASRGRKLFADPACSLTIASWLLVVEPGQVAAVRAALDRQPGIECRSEARGTLVVLTETPSAPGLDPLRARLESLPGVREASLVTAFDETPALS